MTARVAQALHVYLGQRWAMPILTLLSLITAGMLFGASLSMRASGNPLMLANVLGLPAMGVAFWVTTTAKWQFVNPRARLTPGFATPHLWVAAAWLALGMVVYPLLAAGLLLPVDPLASVAYAVGCGALFVWGMHTMRPTFSVLGIASYFAPMAPWLRGFWYGDPEFAAARVLLAVAGVAGIVAWLQRLTMLTEEDESYVIPTQAQSGKVSRMEKSEARRNMALQLSRSKLACVVVDWWNDPLASRAAADNTPARQRLLEYGYAGVPAWIRCLWLLGIMVAVGVTNSLVLGRIMGSASAGAALPSGMMFLFIGPAISAQMLAARRPRMQAELMLPLTRTEFIAALSRSMAYESLLMWLTGLVALAVMVALAPPAWLTAEQVVVAVIASAVGVLGTYAVGMRTALFESVAVRLILLMVGIYVVVGCLVVAGYVCLRVNHTVGGGIMAATLVAGLLMSRHAFRCWRDAELG